jgi:phosphoglycerate kinase
MIRMMEHMAEHDEKAAAPTRTTPFELDPSYSIQNLNLLSKNVVARFDFNVPVHKGVVMDDLRVRAALPTMRHILESGAKRLVLVVHFGRPKGKDAANSVNFLVPILEKLLERPVKFLPNGVSKETLTELDSNAASDEGTVYLLENIRFHPEEEKFDATNEVSAMYQEMGDVMIADCFGCVHRNHMSIVHLKGDKKQMGYGFLIEQEVKSLLPLLSSDGLPGSRKKVLGIMGGAKIADKQPMIDCLAKMPGTRIFVGGGLTRGWNEKYPITPATVVVARDAYGAATLSAEDKPNYIPSVEAIGGGGFDIGPAGLRDLYREIDNANVIFWNGCLGVIEDDRYRTGSRLITDYLLSQTQKTVIIGGGETASLFAGQNAPHIYLSTGGGALLGHLAAEVNGTAPLPGLGIFAKVESESD